MKFKKLILISVLGIATLFSSCKKGADDPAFSFMSRDARITADWVLSSMNETNVHVIKGGSSTYTTTKTYVFDGTTIQYTLKDDFGTQTTSYPYSYEININKKGTYNETEVEDGEKTETTDYWFWANSDKNKIAISFSGIGTYMINRLAKDELVLTQATVSSNTDGDGNVTSDTNNISMTFSKK